jgi:hypothetical protein
VDTIVWSTPAMCMIPTADTVRDNKYITTAGRIKFRVGQAGRITFVAPIQTPLPEGEYFLRAHLERRIPDLFGTEIALRRARRGDGAVTTVLECVGVQGGSDEDNVRFSDSEGKQLEVDLDASYYWVQVTDVNTSPATSTSVDAVLGVGLLRRV